jgi:hypothetical protein
MFDIFYLDKKPSIAPHEQHVNSLEQAQQLCRTRYFWLITYLVDFESMDWLWEPPPWQAHQRQAWPSQWQKDCGVYLVPKSGYTETNYRTDQIITRLPDPEAWDIPNPVEEFDYSWHPDPTDPPLTYYFGTQWQRTGGPVYRNGSDTIKIVDFPRAVAMPTKEKWHNVNGEFDYSWHPDLLDPPLTYYFGTQWQRTGGPIYRNGSDTIKIVDFPRAVVMPTEENWHNVNGEFDCSWHPDLLDNAYIYQFGTQHQRTGGPQYIVPGATEIKYVDQLQIKTNRIATALIEIDHLDGHAGNIPNTTKTTRYVDNYLDTLRRIAKSIEGKHEFAWICSSVCDYTYFDFTWHPEQWQVGMLHVFASDGEKFGDTFFMHVSTFLYRSETCQLLEWYDLNFVDMSVPRRPMPVVVHKFDSQATAVKSIEFTGPLALFTINEHTATDQLPAVPLWREKTKTIVPLSPGASSVVVPKTAIPAIKEQLYDYLYIDKTHTHIESDQPLDIVFLSNGEPSAEDNYQTLLSIIEERNFPNRVVRVKDVVGRIASQHAAANSSNTNWYFSITGKLRVNSEFDFLWQPDRLQQPKHYIFTSTNPVNQLEYGHQAIVANNKKLTLATKTPSLDFTMDSLHEVVNINCGVAIYNTDSWTTWRTAFREVVKLRYYYETVPDVETEYRLDTWLKQAQGDCADWNLRGAHDAIDYYQSVGGQYHQLLLTFDWAWLRQYFDSKYQ